jgi:hypothetical protein
MTQFSPVSQSKQQEKQTLYSASYALVLIFAPQDGGSKFD